MKTLFSQFINLITLFFISILILGGILIVKSEKERDNQVIQEDFCGIIYPEGYNEENGIGRDLFIVNCATCHHLAMRTDATGPALANTWEKWNNDTTVLFSYI